MDVVDPGRSQAQPRVGTPRLWPQPNSRTGGKRAPPGRCRRAASLHPTALSTLLRCLAFAFWLTLSVAAHAEGVLLLTTSPSPPGRFVALEQAAREHGLPLRTRFIEKIAADELTPALWQAPSWCRCWAHCSRPATTPPRCSRRR